MNYQIAYVLTWREYEGMEILSVHLDEAKARNSALQEFLEGKPYQQVSESPSTFKDANESRRILVVVNLDKAKVLGRLEWRKAYDHWELWGFDEVYHQWLNTDYVIEVVPLI